jgi:hypothetical protein
MRSGVPVRLAMRRESFLDLSPVRQDIHRHTGANVAALNGFEGMPSIMSFR